MTTGRRIPLWVLFVALVAVPLAELWLLIQVGQVIGAWWTILVLVAMSLLGGWLIKHEGARAWRALAGTLSSGRMPTRELADGALIVLGGALMLTPGFLSDLVGIFLILPMTRPVARAALTASLGRRLTAGAFGPSAPRNARHPGPGPEGPVVRGDVVDP